MKKFNPSQYNLKNFEFSQNYFMFFDKFEKSNYFLESIIKTLDEPYDSRLMMHLLDSPVQDGGQWDMFVNLINKYGVVPKEVMPETNHSSKSMAMNYILTHKLEAFEIKYKSFIPSEKLLVETDSPYLAPLPFRGKSNEPSYIIHIVEYCQYILGV